MLCRIFGYEAEAYSACGSEYVQEEMKGIRFGGLKLLS